MNRIGHSLSFGWILVAALAAPALLRAQQPAAEALQQNVVLRQEANPNVTADTTDADLGDLDIVQRYPKPDTFAFTTTQQFFYTDNVFYTNANQVGSTAYLGSYTASVVPYSTVNWTPRISLQYNMVRYGSAASGDFDNESAAISSQYVFTADRAWSWTSAVNVARFTDPHANDHQFYSEIAYDNQISYVHQFCQDIPLFFVGAYGLTYHQANPDIFDRLDNTLSFGLTYNPIPTISLGPFVRPSARTYLTNTPYQNDRDDFNLSEGFDATWTPIKYVSLSADISRTDDYSNAAGQSYSDTSPGVSLTGTLKF